ncbi:uncharacterized protein BYT42DRAFT_565221 [Radiomyces spectabilis]|uniref:uncharacterized protein n=1 Tax=Radiomyces spectabilis TaxID=64574 RepID=UPI00221FEC1E|nr:uncharacterized protein BYT42DRAFT_565221 [Radiomyces spectabilis]KAI8381095.1 hypothetical protein BYT42DRAFT_565221 [Radiomyces spectabilis]
MLLTPVIRASLYKRTAAFHTVSITLAEREGLFGKFNPWAKKPASTPEAATAPSNTESIDPVTFDVKYHDDQEIVSWKNADIMTDPESIHSTVRTIVLEHNKNATDADWKSLSLKDLDVKYKIVKESMKQIGKEVPNLELNNMQTVEDMLAFFQRPEDKVATSSIEAFFQDNADTLPSNLTFAPREKTRL